MTVPNRNILGKGIFAVSVVAVTAVVGSVGFAQAQLGSSDGYGGTGALIRAAVAQFETAVADAQSKLQSDIATCVGNNPVTAGVRTTTNQRNNSAINQLRTVSVNPARLSQSATDLDRTINDATNRATDTLTTNDARMLADLDAAQIRNNRNGLSQCLRQATSTFRTAVQTARQELLATIRDILRRH